MAESHEAIVAKLESLKRQEDMVIDAMNEFSPNHASRLKLRRELDRLQAEWRALAWASGDYTWPKDRSMAATKRLVKGLVLNG